MKRKILIAAIMVCIFFTATACSDESIQQEKKEAKFSHICKENGGHVFYTDTPRTIYCDFS